MKKFLNVILFVILFIPFGIKAYGIDNYFIDATIEENGDLLVEEYFNLTGEYNGFERIINYKNDETYEFDSNRSSFGGSSIHNGTNLEIIKVGTLPISDNINFKNINVKSFKLNYLAKKGDYGVYKIKKTNVGKNVVIYNPDKHNRGFYIKYRIKNIAIKHNDVAELGWNIIGNELSESIENLKLYLHIPGNTNIKAWAHGPLNGNIDIIDSETVLLTINELNSNRTIDIRITFDLNIISKSTKKTDVDALNKIMLYEEDKAEQANYERQKKLKLEEMQEKKQKMNNIIFSCIMPLITLILSYYIYIRYVRNPKAIFNQTYLRDFPSDASPEIVSYLFNKKITNKAISASVMNLIRKKIILAEKIEKDNYKLTINQKYNKELTEIESKLIMLIFQNKKTIHTKNLKSNVIEEYDMFVKCWNDYIKTSLNHGKNEYFYELDNIIEKKYYHKIPWHIFQIIIILVCFIPSLIYIAIPIVTIYIIYIIIDFIKYKYSNIYGEVGKINYKKIILIAIIIFLIFICFIKIYDMLIIQQLNKLSIIVFIICIFVQLCLLILINNKNKKTIKGAEEYRKWKALKKFLNDFGKFDDKQVLDVALWEKYLVYATLFGCAEKVLKQINLKFESNINEVFDNYSDFCLMNKHITTVLLNSNRLAFSIKSSKMSNNYNSERSYMSDDNYSSGSGDGGGFSSGGGSFGGGGGGSRF